MLYGEDLPVGPDTSAEVRRVEPAGWLKSEGASAMHFLNGAAERFPEAISLAAGRPPDLLMGAERTPGLLTAGIMSEARRSGVDARTTWSRFAQYSDTNGIVLQSLRRLLERTEGIDADACWLQITNGIQEAMLIECLRAKSSGGAVIAFDPTYVGIAGASALAGVPLYVVPRGGRPSRTMANAIDIVRRNEKGPILCYVVADHDNPTGLSLSLDDRQALVDLAKEEGLTILEDSAYRLFNYDGAREPSLFSLDGGLHVVHMVSFSKTFMPGLRLGFTVRGKASVDSSVLDQVTAIKSFVSVLTAPMAQAMLAGFLAEIDYDLDAENSGRRQWCRANRDALVKELSAGLGGQGGVRWRVPAGGFFLAVDVPFDVDMPQAIVAARRYGVVTLPMKAFSPTGRTGRAMRLSFSAGDVATTSEGGRRFSQFVRDYSSCGECQVP